MTPTATTKAIADCEATCIPFPGYPNGVELFARVLGAGKPAVAALGGLFDAVKAGVDPQMLQAALGIGSPGALLAVALPALQAVDTAPLFAAVPDIVRNIVADPVLLADLLAMTTVIVDGKNHKLNSRKAIGDAVGHNYALLVGLVWFALEVNFRGPFGDVFGGLLKANPRSPVAAADS